MPLNKMGNFSFQHINQQDDLYKTKTASEIKAALDSQPNELKVVFNNLIDSLQATIAGDSGAKNLGVSAISGVTGANIQAVLEDLKLQINGAVTGSIPDGSITQAKLAFEVAANAAGVSIADTGAHFTATNVEGALDELFQSANSVKTNVSGAIGSPSTVNDTGAQLAGYITTEKGRIASDVGDGASTDTLKYLVDRLNVRLDELATNVSAKGVASTSADTLAQLVTKVGQISTGKKWASGTATSATTTSNFEYLSGTTTMGAYPFSVNGLSFKPTRIVAYASNSTDQGWVTEYTFEKLPGLTGLANGQIMILPYGGGNYNSKTIYAVESEKLAATVIVTGFTLPTMISGATVTWYAYE